MPSLRPCTASSLGLSICWPFSLERSGTIKVKATHTINATLLDIVQRLEVYVKVIESIKHLPMVEGAHVSTYIQPGESELNYV